MHTAFVCREYLKAYRPTHTSAMRHIVPVARVHIEAVIARVWSVRSYVCEQLYKFTVACIRCGCCARKHFIAHTHSTHTWTDRSRWRINVQCASVTTEQSLTHFILLFPSVEINSLAKSVGLSSFHFTHYTTIVYFSSFFSFPISLSFFFNFIFFVFISNLQ